MKLYLKSFLPPMELYDDWSKWEGDDTEDARFKVYNNWLLKKCHKKGCRGRQQIP